MEGMGWNLNREVSVSSHQQGLAEGMRTGRKLAEGCFRWGASTAPRGRPGRITPAVFQHQEEGSTPRGTPQGGGGQKYQEPHHRGPCKPLRELLLWGKADLAENSGQSTCIGKNLSLAKVLRREGEGTTRVKEGGPDGNLVSQWERKARAAFSLAKGTMRAAEEVRNCWVLNAFGQ